MDGRENVDKFNENVGSFLPVLREIRFSFLYSYVLRLMKTVAKGLHNDAFYCRKIPVADIDVRRLVVSEDTWRQELLKKAAVEWSWAERVRRATVIILSSVILNWEPNDIL